MVSKYGYRPIKWCRIFFYLKKAFDTVDHEILLRKLNIYGIRGSALAWINSYLTGRKQYCQVDGHFSDPLCVTTGIPQGSALGPLLFLIYINDIPQCLEHTNANMFADDTQIETSGYDISIDAEKLNKDLENVSTWMSAHKLTLNRTKTEYMIIGSNKRVKHIDTEPCLHINDREINGVKISKSLGTMIDENLSWNDQVDQVTKKVNSGLSILSRFQNIDHNIFINNTTSF